MKLIAQLLFATALSVGTFACSGPSKEGVVREAFQEGDAYLEATAYLVDGQPHFHIEAGDGSGVSAATGLDPRDELGDVLARVPFDLVATAAVELGELGRAEDELDSRLHLAMSDLLSEALFSALDPANQVSPYAGNITIGQYDRVNKCTGKCEADHGTLDCGSYCSCRVLEEGSHDKCREGTTIGANDRYTNLLMCSPANASICSLAGGACEPSLSTSGARHDLCRWADHDSNSACADTDGLWTTAWSRFALNWPTAILAGTSGACITQMRNIGGTPY